MIGIALGSKNTSIAHYENNLPSVVLSETSKRQIPSLVSFSDKERLFGEAAQFTYKSNYENSINILTRLIGISSNYNIHQNEQFFTPVTICTNNQDLYFSVNAFGNKEFINPAQALGCFLSKLKEFIENKAIVPKSVTISVPDYLTIPERQGIIDAAQIASLPFSNLINESSAISIAFGYQRREGFSDKPYLVGFLDFGYSNTSFFISSFTKNCCKVEKIVCNRNLGVRQIDELIYKRLITDFDLIHGTNSANNQKVKVRLLSAIEKARQELTANLSANVTVESIVEDYDLVKDLSRDDFEKIIAPVTENLTNLLFDAVSVSGSMLDGVREIEMAGDGLRIPILQNLVVTVLGKKVSKRITPDVAVVEGACLVGAIYSPYFNTFDYSVQHFNMQSITIKYMKPQLTNESLFQAGCSYPTTRQINVSNDSVINGTFSFAIGYGDYLLSSFKVVMPLKGSTVLSVVIELTNDGMIQINSMACRVNGQQCLPSVERINTYGLSNLIELTNKEIQFSSLDSKTKEVYEKRNELESYIFSTKDKLNGILKEYLTEEENKKVLVILNEAETMLYDQPPEISFDFIVSLSNELMDKTAFIYNRYNFHTSTFEEMNKISATISKFYDIAEKYRDNREAAYKENLNQEQVSQMIFLLKSLQIEFSKTLSDYSKINKVFDNPEFALKLKGKVDDMYKRLMDVFPRHHFVKEPSFFNQLD